MGIIHKTTAGYAPQSNGVAKRKNQTLQEMVNSMLSYANLSDGFWEEAMLTTCHILNEFHQEPIKETLYQLWFKKKPNISYLKVSGCRLS